MNSSILSKDEVCVRRVCHHISTGLYRRVKSTVIEAVHLSSYSDEVNVWIRTCPHLYIFVAHTRSAYGYFLLANIYLISLVTGVHNMTLFFCDGVRLAVWNFSPTGPLFYFLADK